MTQPAISVRGLSKCYRLGTIGRHTLADEVQYLWHRIRGRDPWRHMARVDQVARRGDGEDHGGDGRFWALRDVSFDVQPGEVVGIVGRNGAGKSTLLKILTRITEPTSGEAVLHGRVASLLEVGTGFHPELTGRENIFMNGTILGMRKAEIERKFDEIVAFSEIEQFIDTPVKRYSSGMYVRLAFSVAAHLDPEILLVDEVLAVGDANFQRKCLAKMGTVAQQGRTILFVSHNMAAVQNLCTHCVVFQSGEVAYGPGPVEEGVQVYLSRVQREAASKLQDRTDRQGAGRIRLVDFTCLDEGVDRGHSYIASGRPVVFRLHYLCDAPLPLENVEFAIGISSRGGSFLTMLSSGMTRGPLQLTNSEGCVECVFERLPLAAGQYVINVIARHNDVIQDWVREAAILEVESGDFFDTGRTVPASHAGVLVPQRWRLSSAVCRPEVGPGESAAP